MRSAGTSAGLGFNTEIMMDELGSRCIVVNMDPVEFRIKNLPPQAPRCHVGILSSERARRSSAGASGIATGDQTTAATPRPAWAPRINTWGGGGRGPAPVSLRDRVGWRRGDASAGARRIWERGLHLVAVITADSLGLQPSQVRPEIGDTLYGVSPLSGGSTTAASISPGIRVAAIKALDALKEKVAQSLNVSAASLVAAGGRVQVNDDPSKGLSWADACKRIGPQPIGWRTVIGSPWMSSTTTSGAQFAEVKVDVETGIVKVTRVLVVQDCGLVRSAGSRLRASAMAA